MSKENRAHTRRIRNLVVISALTAIILSVSTYAWFVGMQTVNVTSFDVEIKTADSLQLSLDGVTWSETVSISKDNFATTYTGNTNSWGGKGLIPMSSVGDMEVGSSRMKLFEKASLTPTAGGYRLLASRVKNYGTYTEDPDGTGPLEIGDPVIEQDGYVAFDLFIKNFTGAEYIRDLVESDEEAIYLTKDSSVTVALDGVPNTGIENSVRVAFAQIGRVIGTTTDGPTVTGITCTSSTDNDPVTGICRQAQIWEPNDINHVGNAISWYETSCLPRLEAGTNVRDPESYDDEDTCSPVVDGTAYSTYAIAAPIRSTDNVDVYDGTAYNGYTHSEWTSEPEDTRLLKAYSYFTDTKKMLAGVQRPKFMDLAPNSITKVRVYIYIEGQDIDNYDFASIGRKIAVKFGFTKERFTEDDIDYDGPDLDPAIDQTSPVVTLNGDNPMTVIKDAVYTEPGVDTAVDNVDGEMTLTVDDGDNIAEGAENVFITGEVDTATVGQYTVTYKVYDAAGNPTIVTRIVNVVAE